VPDATLRSLGTLARQAEECKNILDVVGGELFHHLIPYSLAKCNHYRGIGDTRNDITNLRELLDEGTQGFPRALLDGVEISLITRPSKSALKVGHELTTQFYPWVEGPLREIHEPGPGRPSQGYGEVVGHDSLIPTYREDEVE
jgi:hypothetical protein